MQSQEAQSAIQIKAARLYYITDPQTGKTYHEVLTDWQNVSKKTIYALYADIILYDAQGKTMEAGATDHLIFSDSRGILPGQNYFELSGEGFLVTPYTLRASRVIVRQTRVLF